MHACVFVTDNELLFQKTMDIITDHRNFIRNQKCNFASKIVRGAYLEKVHSSRFHNSIMKPFRTMYSTWKTCKHRLYDI